MTEIFHSDRLRWTVQGVGNISSDDIILPKSIATECSISGDGFDRIYYACMSGSSTNKEAYEKAEELHVQYFEKRKYSDYESFRVQKYRRDKKTLG